MFLFDSTFAADFSKAKEEVQRILQRAGAEIVFLEKWEERKLAYEIDGRKRGCYVLTYFNCDGSKIVGIERDARLSEPILRILVKKADGITREQMEKYMPHHGRSAEDRRDSQDDDDRDDDDDSRESSRRPSRRAVAVADDDDSVDDLSMDAPSADDDIDDDDVSR
jgi:small subunit ribosomal protein S6